MIVPGRRRRGAGGRHVARAGSFGAPRNALATRGERLALVTRRRGAVVVAASIACAAHLGGTRADDGANTAGPGASAPASNRLRPVAADAPVATGPAMETRPSFVADIRPILARRCFSCHAGDDAASSLNLDDRAKLLLGGESGAPAVVPGKPDASRLLLVVDGRDADLTMPPKGPRLDDRQIAAIRSWIEHGASWDANDAHGAGAAPSDASGSPAVRPPHWHWAYQAPVRVDPPPVRDAGWPRNAIDRFVLARLEREGLEPSPEADPATLLRRVSLDLTGLPPSVEALDAFVRDARPDAYERAVDRLLESPRFGEHWARLWLDLARYADTHGYEKDARRSMWPWRDWVIDAFNRDLPFDEFTRDQLAGDLLPDAGLAQLVATGFIRNSMINEEGGVDPDEFQAEATIDRVNTFASVWLGSTIACCQCHDHKYDPFPQRDYYRLYAFFNQDVADTVRINSHENRAASPTAPFVAEKDRARADQLVRARAALLDAGAAPRGGAGGRAGGTRGLALRVHAAALGIELDRLAVARTMVMGSDTMPRESFVFIRGSFLNRGERVAPGTPAVLPPLGEGLPRNRLGLAAWLLDPSHPLTARVAVNRLWERLFGRGIVATSEDFGTQGEAPTHPELLDWMATEFPRLGWSTKSMLRLMVTSSTYRQSSLLTPALRERDPENALLARMSRFRLDAETIRDTALCASGLLAARIGGPSVFPPQPPGIWTMIYSNDQWVESEGDDRHRRGLYTFWRRTAPYPSFAAFDAPSRELACTRRARTNTPLQALVTLNDPAFVEAANALAKRLRREAGGDPRAQIVHGFRLCTSRTPTSDEVARLAQLFSEQRAAFAAAPAQAAALLAPFDGTTAAPTPLPADETSRRDALDLAAMQMVASVLLNLDETLTRG